MDVSEVLLAQNLRESPSTDDLRVRLRRQGGQSRLAPRPSSAGSLGVGPQVGHRGMGTEELPVCAMFSQQFTRMKMNVPYVRPQSGYARTESQIKQAALAESEGYTVTAQKTEIRNDKIGFIQGGMRFPWQLKREQIASVRELPMAKSLASFKELPAEAKIAAEVDMSLEHVYQSYFPVSRLW